MNTQAWVDLDNENVRNLLISLIGHRFGERPEERLDEIRGDRSRYANKFISMASIKPSDTVLDLGSGCGFGTAIIAGRAKQLIKSHRRESPQRLVVRPSRELGRRRGRTLFLFCLGLGLGALAHSLGGASL